MRLLILWWLTTSWLACQAAAMRKLTSKSLVTCMENSKLSAEAFNVTFNPHDRSLRYSFTMSTDIDAYISAHVEVYAYGFQIITKTLDLCSMNWKQFCPLRPGNVEIESVEYVAQKYVNVIPGIAYHVPDIDAYARVRVYNRNTNEYLACIQAFFSNGKTVSQTGVKWASAVIAGLGLLLSASLSTFGNSTAASHISANTMSLFLYFQSVVVVAMEHVHRVPPIAEAWSENLAWSMGLIRITFMQRIFRWYVQSTGGTPALNLTSRKISVLTQRSLEYLRARELYKRAKDVLYGNSEVMIFRGIKRLAFDVNIENTAIVCTGFTFFVLCGYVLAGFIIVCKCSLELCIRSGWVKSSRFIEFRLNWRQVLKGAMLRYIYIGFTQLTILSFWEFTQRDSAAVIVIACLFIVLSVGLMVWTAYRTFFFAQRSIRVHHNPAALLYGDERVLSKYGFFYTMFNAKHYWWNFVILSYMFIKALIIGFAQSSGQTQALMIFIFELIYFVAIIYYQPYLDRPTNILNIFISTVTLINSFLFLFFSDLFNQSYKVSAIMGWIFFILNAAFSLILLLMILAFAVMILFTKNPDVRFKPARDDRRSFQRHSLIDNKGLTPSVADELMALGDVAKDHSENWESQLSDKTQMDDVNIFAVEDEKLDDLAAQKQRTNSSSSSRKPTLKDRIWRKLSLGRTKRRNESTEFGNNDITSLTPVSSSPPSNSPPKRYPGVNHERQESDSHNRLMDSYDDVGEGFNFLPVRESDEHRSEDDFEMADRNMSLDTINHNDPAAQGTDILGTKFN
ncbi:FLC3 (YGL139W) and FLC1 (YPL221W) [Zygosaccharomyces parabailii]|nr:FLC3 (YGL139W) and FLC1 (YPL221W) [Zygosaccharomyces parabailii]